MRSSAARRVRSRVSVSSHSSTIGSETAQKRPEVRGGGIAARSPLKIACIALSVFVRSKVTSDTNGRVTATDPVNTAVSDLQPKI